MKKFGLIISALALVLGMSQCRQPDLSSWHLDELQEVEFTTNHGGGQKGSFIDNDDIYHNLHYQWDLNDEDGNGKKDKLYVFAQDNPKPFTGGRFIGTMTISKVNDVDGYQATFFGKVRGIPSNGALRFVHYGQGIDVDIATGTATVDFSTQSGGLDEISSKVVAVCDVNCNGTTEFNGELEVQFAVTKLQFTNFGSGNYTVTGMESTGLSVATTGVITENPTTSATFTNPGTNEFYAVFMPNSTQYMFESTTKIAQTETWTFEKDKFYTKGDGGVATGLALPIAGEDFWDAAVTTIPVCAIHATCASSGGMMTRGSGAAEQGVIWAEVGLLGSKDLTLATCTPTYGGGRYIHNGVCPNGTLTTKDDSGNTFTGFMRVSGGKSYVYRAYIKKSFQVKYGECEVGDELLSFNTPSSEPFPTTETVNFGKPNLNWAKYNLGYDPAMPEGDYEQKFLKYRGDFYQWGDIAACTATDPDKRVNCNWYSYRYCYCSDYRKLTKYCTSSSYWYNKAGTMDNTSALNYEDDCVRQTLGDSWRLPTKDEWNTLYNNNRFVYIYQGNTNSLTGFTAPCTGCLVIKGGKNGNTEDNSIYMFLPFGGERTETSQGGYPATVGVYLSNSLDTNVSYTYRCATVNIYFSGISFNVSIANYVRYMGYLARPVYN